MLAGITALSAFAMITATVSWFIPRASITKEDNPISGATLGAYFAYGNGHPTTPQNPNDRVYGITVPRHLYNLAWLQYLGFFNKADENGLQYYFELGNNIDMTGWTLPPIGTEDHPFIGNFNGNGYVIKGLTVSNNFTDYQRHPGEVQAENFTDPHIVGFFGVIGDLNNDYTDSETGATLTGKVYDSSANELIDVGLYQPTIKTNVQNTLVGIVAGYVDATVSNVAVDDPKINVTKTNTVSFGGYTTNLSDYGLVGYCTKEHLRTTDIKSVRANTPIVSKAAADETGNSYGASIPMKDIWDDINGRRSGANTRYDYVTGRSDYYESDGTTLKNSTDTNTTNTTQGSTRYVEVTNNGYTIASYSYHQDSGSYMYMYGEVDIRNYTTSVKVFVETDAYYIFSGNNYLYRNNTNVGNIAYENNATKWMYKNNRLYCQNDTTTYYLTSNQTGTTLSLSTTTSNYNAWTLDEETGVFVNNYTHYYLVYDAQNSIWTTVPQLHYDAFYIKHDNNYLYASSTSAVANTTNQNNATKWIYDGSKIYYLTNNTKYYLTTNANGTLSLSTTASNYNTWSVDGTSFKNAGNNGYIVFDTTNNVWFVDGSTSFQAYYIHDGNNYLSNNGTTGITNVNGQNNARPWIYEDGKLYIRSNNTKYYLTANASGALSLSTTASNYNTWTLNTATGMFTNSGNNQYLVYDNGWKTISKLSYDRYIIYSGNHYFRANNTTLGDTTTQDSATNWYYDSDTNKLFTYYNNTVYYVTVNNSGTLSLSTTASTGNNWTLDANNHFYNSTYSRYIIYDNGWKGSTSLTYNATTYKFASTGGYYLTANSSYNGYQSGVTNANNATAWLKDSNGYYCENNGNKYYVGYSDGLVLSTSPNRYFADHSNGGNNYLRASRGGTNYAYLRYNNGWTTRNSRNANDALTITTGTASISYDVDVTHSTTTYSASNTSTTLDYSSSNVESDINYSSANSTTTFDEYKETRSEDHTLTTKATFIPLKYNENKTDIHSDNTGYIVSGGNSGASDLRVSRYQLAIQYSGQSSTTYNLGVAFGNNSTTYTETTSKRFEIVTKTISSNGYARISDDYNKNNSESNVSNQISGFPKLSTETLGLKKYNTARKTLHGTMLSGGQYVYGLHFMNAQINKNNVITPDRVMVNGWEYKDNKAYEYVPRKENGKIVRDENGDVIKDVFDRGNVGGRFELPEDCIEFNLSENGTINFFAGSYFSGNDAFFSLHRIFRDTNDSDGDGSTVDIKEIKEIRKVYENSDYDVFTNNSVPRYVYEYRNADSSTSYSEGTAGDLLFDCSWITDLGSEMIMYAAYYFEIPAIPGEYALGSVSGHTGAYLIYLDIGAADDSNDKMYVEELITTTVYIYEHPDGVDFQEFTTNESGDLVFTAVDGDSSGTVIIPKGVSGLISFNIADNILTCGPPSVSGTISESTYKADNFSIVSNGSELNLVLYDTKTIVNNKATTYTYDADNNRLLTEIEEYIKTTSSDGTSVETENSSSSIATMTQEQYDLIRVAANDEATGVKHFEFYYYAPQGTNLEIVSTYEYNATTEQYTYVFEIVADYQVDIHVTYIRSGCTVQIKRVNSAGTAMENITCAVDNSYTIYNKQRPE